MSCSVCGVPEKLFGRFKFLKSFRYEPLCHNCARWLGRFKVKQQ